jgi:hypothetical protein
VRLQVTHFAALDVLSPHRRKGDSTEKEKSTITLLAVNLPSARPKVSWQRTITSFANDTQLNPTSTTPFPTNSIIRQLEKHITDENNKETEQTVLYHFRSWNKPSLLRVHCEVLMAALAASPENAIDLTYERRGTLVALAEVCPRLP